MVGYPSDSLASCYSKLSRCEKAWISVAGGDTTVTGYSSGAAWVTADDDNEHNILLTRVQLDPKTAGCELHDRLSIFAAYSRLSRDFRDGGLRSSSIWGLPLSLHIRS